MENEKKQYDESLIESGKTTLTRNERPVCNETENKSLAYREKKKQWLAGSEKKTKGLHVAKRKQRTNMQ